MSTDINMLKDTVETASADIGGINVRALLKRTVEALLFSSSEPLSLERIRAVTNTICSLAPTIIKNIIAELNNDYKNLQLSFHVEEIGGGFLLTTTKQYAPYVTLLHNTRRPERLSPAATEVLAIIAYRQPITRVIIEKIRGVDSSGVTGALLERNLITVVGKADTVGRPSLYGTTPLFLRHFGLKSLDDLPPPDKISAVDFFTIHEQ